MSEFVTAFFIIAGGFFAFAAALGVLRLPDVLTRMHASTKAGTLGCGLILGAAALYFGDTGTVGLCIAAIVFLFLTAPVAAHMIGRAAYRTGVPLSDRTVIDEMAAGEASDRNAAAEKQTANRAPP